MQPMQVALAKKRVKGDPVKSHFQDHDKHQMEVYHAAWRFRFSMFIKSITVEVLENDHLLEGGKPLLSLEERMKQFCIEFETSDHEPSRVVAPYLKDVSSYSCCKDGIRDNNYWLLEKESCDWMGHWKQYKKKNCLRLQAEHIEKFYGEGFDPWLRETLRRNSLCVITDRLCYVAMDEAYKIFNAWLKIPAPTPY